MSDETTKIKHSKRIWNTETVIVKRRKLLKQWKIDNKEFKQKHRLSKMNGINCGDPKCLMCMNPRRAFKQKTLKEIAFEETKNWE